ncbi:MAG: hypothetical protein M3Q80_01900 [bacterium]|nr:hypothetical protein [bacterium]
MKKLIVAIIASIPLLQSVQAQQPPNYGIISPDYSETLTNGTQIVISYTAPIGVTNVYIKLMTNDVNGVFITPSTRNTGQFVWTVSRLGYPASTPDFYLRVGGCDSNSYCNLYTGPNFPIVDQPIKPRITKFQFKGRAGNSFDFELNATSIPSSSNYLVYSFDITTPRSNWVKIVNSDKTALNGNLNWQIRSPHQNVYFGVNKTD